MAKRANEMTLLVETIQNPDTDAVASLTKDAIASIFSCDFDKIPKKETDVILSMIRNMRPWDLNSLIIATQVVVTNKLAYRIAANRSLNWTTHFCWLMKMAQTAHEHLEIYRDKMTKRNAITLEQPPA